MKQTLFLIFLVLTQFGVHAQETFTLSGKVINLQGEPVPLATVFIDGSEKATTTNNDGEFKFDHLTPGTYQLVINMLGNFSVKLNVIIQKEAVALTITLKEKQIALPEVLIGDKSGRDENLKIFTKNFLGQSRNAKECKILNPEILNFTNNRKEKLLEAQSDDFLIVENKRLGYRIKYLLRQFRYNRVTMVTSYDGESIFEPLAGSEKAQMKWEENRRQVYEGSFMHYLRSVYRNATQEEGFITYMVKHDVLPLVLDPRPINIEAYVAAVDKDFIALRFKHRFYIRYDPTMEITDADLGKEKVYTQDMSKKGTSMRLFLNEAVIDRKGSYIDYRSFFLEGFWGTKRIGDQLPFEYVAN